MLTDLRSVLTGSLLKNTETGRFSFSELKTITEASGIRAQLHSKTQTGSGTSKSSGLLRLLRLFLDMNPGKFVLVVVQVNDPAVRN